MCSTGGGHRHEAHLRRARSEAMSTCRTPALEAPGPAAGPHGEPPPYWSWEKDLAGQGWTSGLGLGSSSTSRGEEERWAAGASREERRGAGVGMGRGRGEVESQGLEKGKETGDRNGERRGEPVCRGRPWSWRSPSMGTHMWTKLAEPETLAWAAQLCMAHACTPELCSLSPLTRAHARPSGLPSCRLLLRLRSHTLSGRLLSQAQAVPPRIIPERASRLISFPSYLSLSLSFPLPPSLSSLSLFTSEAPQFTVSLSVSEGGG